MRKEIQPPAGPASSCSRCYRPGIVSDEQVRGSDSRPLSQGLIRFTCVCGNAWQTSLRDAMEQGRFLRRIDQSANPGGPQ